MAPHADDESLGVGGTILRCVAAGLNVCVAVMTGPGEGPHPLWPHEAWDTVRAEATKACEVLGVSQLIFRELPAVLLPDEPVWKVTRDAAEVLEEVAPDILFVPFPFDLHRDHREVFYAFSVAWRPTGDTGRGVRAIYAYETASETHWNPPYLEAGFTPNVYIDISAHLEAKLSALACYESQMASFPSYRSLEAIRAQSMWRGAQAGMHAAEAFVCIRQFNTPGLDW